MLCTCVFEKSVNFFVFNMAMLAEPRRKQRVINLRAKNSAWSNDSNKFGQKLLEKMGWSKGKGLGAKENGIVEHVVAKYKNDDKGLGFEDRNDQWTKHEDDFNALLANLASDDSKDEKLLSGVSLEDKSKKSRKRVHYHKFTRGKDLSRYSEKDLANIFGKKSFNNKQKEAILKDDIKTTEQIFTEKGSMEDYFKSKLAALKGKSKVMENSYDNVEDNDNANYSFKGFSGTANTDDDEHREEAFQPFSFYSKNKQCEEYKTLENTEVPPKKKKKKNEDIDSVNDQNAYSNSISSENGCKSNSIQESSSEQCKKKNKSKICPDLTDNTSGLLETNICSDIRKPKKKKNKAKFENTESVNESRSDSVKSGLLDKGSKKQNNKNESFEHVIEDFVENPVVSKKKKHKRNVDEGVVEQDGIKVKIENKSQENITKKKKKKKRKHVDIESK